MVRRLAKLTKHGKINNVRRQSPDEIKELSQLTPARAQKGGAALEEGYTSYGYIGTVNGQLIEVVSPEELYELLEEDGD